VSAPDRSEVKIVVSGGIVQSVTFPDGTHLPADVWDYDTDGADEDDLETDEDGDQYAVYSP
jgi:hypothetical protein